MNKLKEAAAQCTNDDTLYFCSDADADADADADSYSVFVFVSPILRFLIFDFRFSVGMDLMNEVMSM